MNVLAASRPLGDLVEGGNISYGIVQPGEHDLRGIPIVRVKDVRDGRIETRDPLRVSEVVSARHTRTVLRGGEVLLSLVGTVGEAAIVPMELEGWNVARAIAVLRPHGVEAEWLRLCFGLPEIKAFIDGAVNTTVQSTLNLADLKRVQVPMPPDGFRIGVIELLGALDDKIAANAWLNATALEVASLKLELALRSGASGFPLGKIAEFHNRRRIPLSAREREARLGTVPYFGATGQFGFVDESIFGEELVLVGEDGSVVTDDGRPVVQYIWGPSWVNNHAHVLTGTRVSTELLYFLLRRCHVDTLVTGAVQPKLSMGNLRSLVVPIPGAGSAAGINALASAAMAQFRALSDESRTLVQLRDTLLPQLMSGKLRVKDAEKQVEAVV